MYASANVMPRTLKTDRVIAKRIASKGVGVDWDYITLPVTFLVLSSSDAVPALREIDFGHCCNCMLAWVLFCPTFLSVRNLYVFALCDLLRAD